MLLLQILMVEAIMEADLLKERLQAITKKALREQWLMDGLSQQSEEEQEAIRLQVQDEQQQSDQLQSNIIRIEKEIEALETQELSVSANEEVVLLRLKEVEQMSEDVTKRATLLDGEVERKELSKGCSTTEIHDPSVAMETTEQSDLPMDCEGEVAVADSSERGEDLSADDKELCTLTDTSDSLVENTFLLDNLPTDKMKFDESESSESSICTEIPSHDHEEALTLEAGDKVLNRNESTTSSASNTLFSADCVCESEALCEENDTSQLDPQQEPISQSEQPEADAYPEPEPEPETEQYLQPKSDLELEQYTESEQYPESEQHHEVKLYPETEFDFMAGEPNPEDDDYQHLAVDTEENPEVHVILFEPPSTEDSVLDLHTKGDVSNESGHDLDPDEMDECLAYEVAAASSDKS
ncbi:tropomyosin-like [Antennarius striatus]|uniref:tropomyosin-like n=1 Tax=Antennarius striatus TaxID=241820 RepID=UPI0035B0D351